MTVANFGPGDKAKIQALINGGVDTMREIATLRESLKDTVEAGWIKLRGPKSPIF